MALVNPSMMAVAQDNQPTVSLLRFARVDELALQGIKINKFLVGVRSPEAIELQRERKKRSNEKKESGNESKANSHRALSRQGARAGLLIGLAQGSYCNALNTPTTYPANTVWSGGNLVDYIKTLLDNVPMGW
jgi:hypothetical protein